MKNHQVNNDYVQNLQEGLLTEAALRMGKKEKGAKPRQTHVGEEDNMGNVATNSARRKNIKDVGMKPMSGTGPGEVRPFNSGSTTTRKLKKVDENAQAGYPEQGIKGGTPKAAATHDRIMTKLKSAGGGKEYARKKAEVEGKVADKEREKLAAAPALASMQK